MKSLKVVLILICLSFSSVLFAGALNINTADANQLAKEMVGVGKSRAEAIVEYRNKNGSFKSIDDLVKVEGIGHRTVEKNRENLSIE